jgi:hypothetical protein
VIACARLGFRELQHLALSTRSDFVEGFEKKEPEFGSHTGQLDTGHGVE